MKNDNISIEQKLVSQKNDGNVIEIIVENSSSEPISDAVVVSQNINHDFGVIDPQTVKTVSYTLNVPSKEELQKDFDFDGELSDELEIPPVTLMYSCEKESFELKSNGLVLVL